MKKFSIALFVLVMAGFAFTEMYSRTDIFQELGLEKTVAEETIRDNFINGGVYFMYTDEMKAMPGVRRGEVVKLMGDHMKLLLSKPDFAEEYKIARDGSKPVMTIELEKIEDLKERAAMKKDWDEELASFNRDFPPTVRGLIARRLQQFLELTDGMDFNTKLVKRDGKYYFADPKLEAKDSDWKMMFRCGREVIAPARAYAQVWLASLK